MNSKMRSQISFMSKGFVTNIAIVYCLGAQALFLSTVKHLPHKKKHGKRNEKNHEVHEEVDEGQENYEEACDEEKHYCEREAREELGVPRNEGEDRERP